MKTRSIFAVLTVLIALTLSSCFSGLDPAWKQETRLTIQLPSVAEGSSDDSRALVLGVGYLYLRTIGGPEGVIGPLYGPFPINKPDFETKLIPPGKFSSILILYSSVLLDAEPVEGEKTFRDILSLPDAELKPYIKPEEGTTSPLDVVIDGLASAGETGPVTIVEGIRNALPTVTLEPITTGSEILDQGAFLFNIDSAPTTMTRRFFKLEGFPAEAAFDELRCYITSSLAPGGTIGRVGLYEANGTLIYLSSPVGYIAADATKTVTAPFTGNETYYVYIEYMGEFDVRCVGVTNVTVPDVNFTLNVTGAGTYAGKRLFASVMNSDMTATGYAVAAIDATGAIALSLYDFATSAPFAFTDGNTYYLSAFIDLNDDLAAYTMETILADPAELDLISPDLGDLGYETTSPFIYAAAAPKLDLVLADFKAMTATSELYVVLSDASGPDPVFSPASGTQTVAPDAIVTVSVPAEFTQYIWYFNGKVIPSAIGYECTVVPATDFPTGYVTGTNSITLEALNSAGEYYTAAYTFEIQ